MKKEIREFFKERNIVFFVMSLLLFMQGIYLFFGGVLSILDASDIDGEKILLLIGYIFLILSSVYSLLGSIKREYNNMLLGVLFIIFYSVIMINIDINYFNLLFPLRAENMNITISLLSNLILMLFCPVLLAFGFILELENKKEDKKEKKVTKRKTKKK